MASRAPFWRRAFPTWRTSATSRKSIGGSMPEQLTLWSEEAPASHSPSRETEKVSPESQGSCSSTYELFERSCRATLSGRTSRERSRANGGGAFRQLLSEMDGLGYGMAWRVLDAQFFGVAQRRRRVFLVGCLGDPRCAAEVLFEPESLRWDSPSSRDKRKALAADSEGGAGVGSYTLLVRCGRSGGGARVP